MKEDSQAFEEEGQDNTGDPVAAFEALRATVNGLAADLGREMATIRKGVEAAFDQFDRQGPPVDYSADLGRLVQTLARVDERLKAVEQLPVLRQGAEHYARVMQGSGDGLVRTAAKELERQAASLGKIGYDLTSRMKGARERRLQNRWLIGIGGAGLVAGILMTLLAPRFLPFSAAPHVASLVMGKDAWGAGMDLMAFGSPASWNRVAAADVLVEENRDKVAACRKAAATTNKDQTCAIIVPAPAADAPSAGR